MEPELMSSGVKQVVWSMTTLPRTYRIRALLQRFPAWSMAASLLLAAFAIIGCDDAFSRLAGADGDRDAPEGEDQSETDTAEPSVLAVDPDSGRQGVAVRINAYLLAVSPDVAAAFNETDTYIHYLSFGPDIKYDLSSVALLRPSETSNGKAGFSVKIIIPPQARTGVHQFAARFVLPSLDSQEVAGSGPFYVIRAASQP